VRRRQTGDAATPIEGRTIMEYAVVHFFAGGTKAQYEASVAAVHPGKGQLPKGQIFHSAGPSKGGWTVVAVHDSKASWEKFRDHVLMPKMKEGIKGGFAAPPQETTFEVHSLVDTVAR
jgi:hypothetical protein